MFHGAGLQAVFWPVRSRAVMFLESFWNVTASSMASPSKMSEVAPVETSSASNWMEAFRIVAPLGTDTPVKRIPTVCSMDLSNTISKSELTSVTLPDAFSSASSEPDATCISTVTGADELMVIATVAVSQRLGELLSQIS